MEERVILYSTGCPKCMILKKKLDEKGVAYDVKQDVDEMLSLGIETVPVLMVNGELMTFAEAVRWVNDYHEEA